MRFALGCESLQAFRHFSAGDERAFVNLSQYKVEMTGRRGIKLWL